MFNAFDHSEERTIYRRHLKPHPHLGTIPASYGVRHGIIKDPNWPPEQIPSEGLATRRRSLRVNAALRLRIAGSAQVTCEGDISEGGIRFVLPLSASAQRVELVAPVLGGGEARAEVQVLYERLTPEGVVHHARFRNGAEALPVWQAVVGALALQPS